VSETSAGREIEGLLFCFLDVETTGLYPYFGDRICEIALVRGRTGEAPQVFHSLVNPQRPISPGAYAVNGISDEMVRYAPRFEELAQRVLEFLAGAVIVAHNAPFDLGFLKAELSLVGLSLPQNPVVDTLRLSRRCFNFPSHSLGNIARCLGIAVPEVHRALSDALTTQEVFRRFLGELRRRGITRLEELLSLQGDLSSETRGALPPLLEEALSGRRPVRLHYLSRFGGITCRTVEPLEVVAHRDYVYLIAFCHLRRDRRTFRLDRVIKLEPVE